LRFKDSPEKAADMLGVPGPGVRGESPPKIIRDNDWLALKGVRGTPDLEAEIGTDAAVGAEEMRPVGGSVPLSACAPAEATTPCVVKVVVFSAPWSGKEGMATAVSRRRVLGPARGKGDWACEGEDALVGTSFVALELSAGAVLSLSVRSVAAAARALVKSTASG
jgi:hypothetical protein